MPREESPYYRSKEASAKLGICDDTLRKLCSQGEIQHIKINSRGDIRIHKSSLLEFMQKNGYSK
jgi:excisionase family DNA binding protein